MKKGILVTAVLVLALVTAGTAVAWGGYHRRGYSGESDGAEWMGAGGMDPTTCGGTEPVCGSRAQKV